jgi:hypothetical protein
MEVCQYPGTLPVSQFTIFVKDPCEEGTIVSSGWSKSLVARQLESDSADLSVIIPEVGGVWPWFSNVEADLGAPRVCGMIIYKITYEDGTFQDFVRFASDENTLVFEPMLYHEITTKRLRLTAFFIDYPGIEVTEYFTTEVTPCVPTIVVDDAQAILTTTNFEVTWGFPVLSTDLSFLVG